MDVCGIYQDTDAEQCRESCVSTRYHTLEARSLGEKSRIMRDGRAQCEAQRPSTPADRPRVSALLGSPQMCVPVGSPSLAEQPHHPGSPHVLASLGESEGGHTLGVLGVWVSPSIQERLHAKAMPLRCDVV